MNELHTPDASSRRVFLLAAFGIAAHQIQSWIAEPEERNFRAMYLALTGLTALYTRYSPMRAQGAMAIVVGTPPLGGAVGTHLLPILRGRPVPPASETAILNLGSATRNVALGVSLLRSPQGESGQG